MVHYLEPVPLPDPWKTYFKSAQKHKNNWGDLLNSCQPESLMSVPALPLCSRKSCYYHFRNSDTGRQRKLFLSFLPVLSGCISPFAQTETFIFLFPPKKKRNYWWNLIKSDEDYLAKHFWCWLPIGYAQWNGWWENAALLIKLPDLILWCSEKAAPLANASFPSSPEVRQHRADSCIWQERCLAALWKELCKQRHLLLLHGPHLFYLSWALAHRQGYTRNGCELRDTWVTPQQSFLCSTSRGVSVMAELLSLGSEQSWHHTAFTQLESTR